MTSARMSNVTFTRVVFKRAVLQVLSQVYAHAVLIGAMMRCRRSCSARQATPFVTAQQGMNFSGCSLIDSDFDECDLTGSNFEGADCSGSRFVGAVVLKVNWVSANMSRTIWRERDRVQGLHPPAATCEGDAGSSSNGGGSGGGGGGEDDVLPKHPLLVSGTDISGCTLDGCDFSCCSIMEFDFRGVSLQRCSFQGAMLTLAVLSRCSVIGCDFSGAR